MFKLRVIPAIVAIGLGSALPVQAGLLDDLIGAKTNPLNLNKTSLPEADKGSFSRPFAEPKVYRRGNAEDANPDLEGTATAEKCDANPPLAPFRCFHLATSCISTHWKAQRILNFRFWWILAKKPSMTKPA